MANRAPARPSSRSSVRKPSGDGIAPVKLAGFRLQGRVEGSLPGSAAGADLVAVLRDASNKTSQIAHAQVRPDGTFEMKPLPETIRGKKLVVDIVAPGSGAPNV